MLIPPPRSFSLPVSFLSDKPSRLLKATTSTEDLTSGSGRSLSLLPTAAPNSNCYRTGKHELDKPKNRLTVLGTKTSLLGIFVSQEHTINPFHRFAKLLSETSHISSTLHPHHLTLNPAIPPFPFSPHAPSLPLPVPKNQKSNQKFPKHKNTLNTNQNF